MEDKRGKLDFVRQKVVSATKSWFQVWAKTSRSFFKDTQILLMSFFDKSEIRFVLIQFAIINMFVHVTVMSFLGRKGFFQNFLNETLLIVLGYAALSIVFSAILGKMRPNPWKISINVGLSLTIFSLGTWVPLIGWVIRMGLFFTFFQWIRITKKILKEDFDRNSQFFFFDAKTTKSIFSDTSLEQQSKEELDKADVPATDVDSPYNEPALFGRFILRSAERLIEDGLPWLEKRFQTPSRLTQASWVMGIIGWILVLLIYVGTRIVDDAGFGLERSLAAGILVFLMALAAFVLFVVGLVMAYADDIWQKQKSWITYGAVAINGIPLAILFLIIFKAFLPDRI